MRRLVVVLSAALVGCPSSTERVVPRAAAAAAPQGSPGIPAVGVPGRAALPRLGLATCTFEGRFAIAANEPLIMGERGEVKARFTGAVIQMRVDGIDTQGAPVASGTIRAAKTAPSMLLTGKVRLDALPFRAARDIPVAGSYVMIARGSPIAIVSSEDSKLGVRALHGDFDGLDTGASCEDVVLGETASGAARASATKGQRMHLTRDRASLFSAPNGGVVIELHARRHSPTVVVTESRDGFHHVAYDDGVRLDGWMRKDDLADGEGADCDDCHGGIMDVEDACPAPKGCPDAKGGPFHARRRVAIRDRASVEGQPLGWLEEDGEVRILERRSGYARVEALKNEIVAPPGGLWIDDATLDPRSK